MNPRVLIITGHGLNCEAESQHAWELAGAAPERAHLHDLLEEPGRLQACQALMFIGGFSYGDHLGSGHVMALRLRHHLGAELQAFVAAGKLVLGVCNGFQIMVKMGLLPATTDRALKPTAALLPNACGTFQNFWVRLRFEAASPCVFTRGLDFMPLPIRHGEGRLHLPTAGLRQSLEASGCIPCRYADPDTGAPTERFPNNPNGSQGGIAGLCDPTGRVFGLMPHPEAYLYPENHPQWDLQKIRGTLPSAGLGLALFNNAVAYLRQA